MSEIAGTVTPQSLVRDENLLARLDRAPMTRTVWLIILLLMLAWLVEAFDIGVIGAGLLILKPAWHLTPEQAGLLGSSGVFGTVLGLLPAGRLADAFGRKRVLTIGVVVFSIFTAASALAVDVRQLAILRFLAGLGEGAVFPVPYLLISEFVNKQRRGEAVGWANFVLTIAYMVPSLVGVLVVHVGLGDAGWRFLFALGGLPLLITPLLARGLPESPRFLLKAGRAEEVRVLVERIEREAGLPHDISLTNETALHVLRVTEHRKIGLLTLLQHPYLQRCFVSFCALGSPFVIFYTTTIYGPTIFNLMGANSSNALLYIAGLQFVSGVGTLAAAALGDRIGRRPTHVAFMLIAGLSLIPLGLKLPTSLLVAAAMAAWFFGVGNFAVPKLYMAEQFPTRLRATGSAVGEVVTRVLFGVVLAYYIPTLLALFTVQTVFAILAALMVILVLPLLFLGHETAGKSVEETGTDLSGVRTENSDSDVP
jgi:putative MFS transporter